MNNCMRT